MDSEIAQEVLPLVRVYKDGRVERLFGTDTVPAGDDPLTGVLSKDVTGVVPGNEEVYLRIYIPDIQNQEKLPLLVYFHGGGFCVSTPADPVCHSYLNKLVAEARVVAVSVHYRRAPEHPIPTAYEDSWAALQWAVSHANGEGPEPWLNSHADFGRVFLSGESAGGNIVHNLAMTAGNPGSGGLHGADILGAALVHSYFWGSDPIGSEALDPDRKATMDRLWPFLCPSNPDNDDPRLNPVGNGAPSLSGLGCRRVLVCVAEKDVMRDRNWMYFQELGRSGWTGVVEIHETEEEDHCFHLRNLESERAAYLIRRLAAFLNRDMPPPI